MDCRRISIIIPVLNEAENLQTLLPYLQANGRNHLLEIIVADGGSKDSSPEIAEQLGARVVHSITGRAIQMNAGAAAAAGHILYFVHADTILPPDFATHILSAVESHKPAGRFRSKIISKNPLLAINSWFTRFHFTWCRGGDQSLFITKETFKALGGFNPEYVIMEEYEFVGRLQAKFSFVIIPENVLISARKYETNSWLRVQVANLLVFNLYRLGIKPSTLQNLYRRMLNLDRF